MFLSTCSLVIFFPSDQTFLPFVALLILALCSSLYCFLFLPFFLISTPFFLFCINLLFYPRSSYTTFSLIFIIISQNKWFVKCFKANRKLSYPRYYHGCASYLPGNLRYIFYLIP